MLIEHFFAIITVIMFKKKKRQAALLLFARKFWIVSGAYQFQP
jgi:tryptophan-rich sensory protein